MSEQADDTNGPSHAPATPRASKRQAVQDAAFDVWLERGLHAMFDDVAKEPIPPELLALIEKSRQQG